MSNEELLKTPIDLVGIDLLEEWFDAHDADVDRILCERIEKRKKHEKNEPGAAREVLYECCED